MPVSRPRNPHPATQRIIAATRAHLATGVRQVELARTIGVTPSAISNVLTGLPRSPTAPVMMKLAQHLGLSPNIPARPPMQSSASYDEYYLSGTRTLTAAFIAMMSPSLWRPDIVLTDGRVQYKQHVGLHTHAPSHIFFAGIDLDGEKQCLGVDVDLLTRTLRSSAFSSSNVPPITLRGRSTHRNNSVLYGSDEVAKPHIGEGIFPVAELFTRFFFPWMLGGDRLFRGAFGAFHTDRREYDLDIMSTYAAWKLTFNVDTRLILTGFLPDRHFDGDISKNVTDVILM